MFNVNSNHNKDQSDYTPKNISEIIEKYSTCLRKIKPDYNLVYADRFESFGAIIASSQMNIPTIHIEGGDKTEGGTLDDNVRHAMTKISHIHITTNEDAKKTKISLPELRPEDGISKLNKRPKRSRYILLLKITKLERKCGL